MTEGRITLPELETLLRKAWSRETSSDPEGWTAENPAWGQCVPTALIVQDFFGGGLLRHPLEGIEGLEFMRSHYVNLVDGKRIDLSQEQLRGATLPEPKIRRRKDLLSPRFDEEEEKKTDVSKDTRRRYAQLRLAVENLISPNPLFEDPIFQMCFANAQLSDCQKMKFGAVVTHAGKIVANTANKFIEPLRYLCEEECIRLNIQSRTESMIGACGHAEEWALKELIEQGIPPKECHLYEIGLKADGTLWLEREYRDFTCLRCAVQMYMAELGAISVPVVDHWEELTPESAVKSSAFYATDKKQV